MAWVFYTALVAACAAVITTTFLAVTLARYLDYRRYFDDWITLTTRAAAVFREFGDRHREGQTQMAWAITHNELRLGRS
ncbi:hypothetical protein ACFZDK_53305 [Streptomyces sp. NPDC007901]|uniref:hypothetical protein n=1 Tax=Streptomyces sp. NPDC007901 TaxID=3364785 RepID=UPI0036E0345E